MKNKKFLNSVEITSKALKKTFTEKKPYSKYYVWLKENILNTDTVFYVYVFSGGLYGAMYSMGVI